MVYSFNAKVSKKINKQNKLNRSRISESTFLEEKTQMNSYDYIRIKVQLNKNNCRR